MSDCRTPKAWQSYEHVSAFLLDSLAKELGLARVEGKQRLTGSSGTKWEVDAKGVREGDEAIVLIECRRTQARQSQSKMGALAYSIRDTGAVGGIVVTPVPFQLGAKKVASAEGIIHVQIDLNSTPEEFGVKFLNKLFLGVVGRVQISDRVTCTVLRSCSVCGNRYALQGNEKVCPSCAVT